jgi:hypothetical protein
VPAAVPLLSVTIAVSPKCCTGSNKIPCEGSRMKIFCAVQEHYPGQFHPRALELIAKRISSASGDMRNALSVCNAARAAAARDLTQRSSADPTDGMESHVSCFIKGTCSETGAISGTAQAQSIGGGAEGMGEGAELISVSQAAEALRVCSSGGSAQAQVSSQFHLSKSVESSLDEGVVLGNSSI